MTTNIFERIHNDESIMKLRIFSVCAFVSSFAFYYFMVLITPIHLDWLPGRLIVALIATLGFAASYKKSVTFQQRRYLINAICFSYITMYFYLLYINDWSVFHRWSYFVVIAILVTIVSTWRDYLYVALFGFFLPFIFGFVSPLSTLELIHFHAANFVTFFVIGLTIKSNFEYRDEVIQLTNNMVQNSKMIALGEMSSGVSHEINNPLAIISNSVAQIDMFLEQGESGRASIQATLDKINRAIFRIVRIVQGLHDFSQSDNKEAFKKADIREMINDSVQLISEKIKSCGVRLIYEAPFEPVYCFCQPLQITQAISNLLSNAFDACVDEKEPVITIIVKTTEDEVSVSVVDNGPGVPKAIEYQVMQPFFTTKPVGKGTGLGLSISLGIARFNQGDLFLNRSVSPSCFTLRLPQAKNQDVEI